jgi:hypothetical protein
MVILVAVDEGEPMESCVVGALHTGVAVTVKDVLFSILHVVPELFKLLGII